MAKKGILYGMKVKKGRLRGMMWSVGLLCYSLLISPLYAKADVCTEIDYNQATIAAGDSTTLGIKSDGSMVAAGSNFYDRLNVSNWSNIKAVSTYYAHTVGLKEDGTFRLLRSEIKDGERGIAVSISYSDYQDASGISFPKEIKVESSPNQGSLLIRYEDIELNPVIDDDLFVLAPPAGSNGE